MKPLAVLLGMLVVSSGGHAYQPVRFVPPPVPYFVPPAQPLHPFALSRFPMPVPPTHFTPPIPWQVPHHPTNKAQMRAEPAIETLPVETELKEPVASSSPSVDKPKVKASASESQQTFLNMLLPIVERENDRLRGLRSDVKHLLIDLESGRATDAQRQQLLALARRYRVNGKVLEDAEARRDLLSRIDTIPSALALAQAANESAWGTSRFAREGNNLFGIWTYDESKGMVPKGRPEGAKYLVRKFENYDASVRYYLHTLNSHPAYQPLRDARAQARSQGKQPEAMKLAAGLLRYSAKGELYVKLIRQLITRYQLAGLVAEKRRAG